MVNLLLTMSGVHGKAAPGRALESGPGAASALTAVAVTNHR
ncbi:hypothetical protein ACFU9X_40830 [Streptomyces atratus]